jgi:hypothetical protein
MKQLSYFWDKMENKSIGIFRRFLEGGCPLVPSTMVTAIHTVVVQ